MIEVAGLDRPGLLSEITGTLSDLSLDIASAHITTFGEKVVDTFYVTDLTGQKIENPARLARPSATRLDRHAGRRRRSRRPSRARAAAAEEDCRDARIIGAAARHATALPGHAEGACR